MAAVEQRRRPGFDFRTDILFKANRRPSLESMPAPRKVSPYRDVMEKPVDFFFGHFGAVVQEEAELGISGFIHDAVEAGKLVVIADKSQGRFVGVQKDNDGQCVKVLDVTGWTTSREIRLRYPSFTVEFFDPFGKGAECRIGLSGVYNGDRKKRELLSAQSGGRSFDPLGSTRLRGFSITAYDMTEQSEKAELLLALVDVRNAQRGVVSSHWAMKGTDLEAAIARHKKRLNIPTFRE